MAEEKRIKPAAYPKTDTPEAEAVATFEFLADKKHLKLDLRKRDKVPNVDGYIEIVDDLECPVGKLEVQIKKLPENEQKLQCPLSLFAYSQRIGNPLLFVAVDTGQKRAYWHHIHTKTLPRPLDKMEQETITIHFRPDNVIDGVDTRYLTEWKNIVESNLRRFRELEKFRELMENSNPVVGIENAEFENMHIFLDQINNLLDGKFGLVKERFFPASWKIGIAYSNYEENSIGYTLYSISNLKNDVQIKQADKKLHQKLRDAGFGWSGYYTENPIRVNPKKHAIDLIEDYVQRILEKKLLNPRGSAFLASEFIFAFVDEFNEPMGLAKKDEYTVAELERGFLLHLPIWTAVAVNFLVKAKRNNIRSVVGALYRRTYFDPHILLIQIMAKERKQIEEAVLRNIEAKKPIPVIPIGNDKFPFRVFFELLSFLKERNVDSVKRIYIPKDFSRMQGGRAWVWDLYSKEAIEANLRTFFANLPDVYNQLLSTNFPEIKSTLPIFGPASRVVALFETEEEAREHRNFPIDIFHFVGNGPEELKIEVFRKDNAGEYSGLSFKDFTGKKEIIIDGKPYTWIGGHRGSLAFIYEDLPMFNYLYELLKENFKRYFDEMRETL